MNAVKAPIDGTAEERAAWDAGYVAGLAFERERQAHSERLRADQDAVSPSRSGQTLSTGVTRPTPELRELHRYTITGEGASKGYYRLVEDAEGAWMQAAEVKSALETVARDARTAERERCAKIAEGFEPLYTSLFSELICRIASAIRQEPV